MAISFSQAAGLVVTAFFGASVLDKIGRLRQGTAAYHPVVVARPALRAFPRTWLGLSVVAETLTICLLHAARSVGGAGAIGLLGLYTVVAWPAVAVPTAGACRCLGVAFLDAVSPGALVLRNSVLAVGALAWCWGPGTGFARASRPIVVFNVLVLIGVVAVAARMPRDRRNRAEPITVHGTESMPSRVVPNSGERGR